MNIKIAFIIVLTSLTIFSVQAAFALDQNERESTTQIAKTEQESEKADESKRKCKPRASERHRMAQSLRCRNTNSGL